MFKRHLFVKFWKSFYWTCALAVCVQTRAGKRSPLCPLDLYYCSRDALFLFSLISHGQWLLTLQFYVFCLRDFSQLLIIYKNIHLKGSSVQWTVPFQSVTWIKEGFFYMGVPESMNYLRQWPLMTRIWNETFSHIQVLVQVQPRVAQDHLPLGSWDPSHSDPEKGHYLAKVTWGISKSEHE